MCNVSCLSLVSPTVYICHRCTILYIYLCRSGYHLMMIQPISTTVIFSVLYIYVSTTRASAVIHFFWINNTTTAVVHVQSNSSRLARCSYIVLSLIYCNLRRVLCTSYRIGRKPSALCTTTTTAAAAVVYTTYCCCNTAAAAVLKKTCVVRG